MEASPRKAVPGESDKYQAEVMTTMVTARVEVRLKKGVADPEGENTLKALRLLGFDQASRVHSIKVFDVELDTEDRGKVQALAEDMCRRLLANPVIHDYSIRLL